jgi:hypothetical protein
MPPQVSRAGTVPAAPAGRRPRAASMLHAAACGALAISLPLAASGCGGGDKKVSGADADRALTSLRTFISVREAQQRTGGFDKARLTPVTSSGYLSGIENDVRSGNYYRLTGTQKHDLKVGSMKKGQLQVDDCVSGDNAGLVDVRDGQPTAPLLSGTKGQRWSLVRAGDGWQVAAVTSQTSACPDAS